MDNQAANRNRRKPLHMADKKTQVHLLWVLALIALAILAVFVLVLASGGHQGMSGIIRLSVSLLVATIIIVFFWVSSLVSLEAVACEIRFWICGTVKPRASNSR